MSRKVYKDRTAASHWPPEDCVDCGKPTKFWVAGGHYPLCLKCAKLPKAGHGAKKYLERMGQCLKDLKSANRKSKPTGGATKRTTTGTSKSSARKGSRGRSSSAR